jgi:hypothetical protein
MNDVPQDEDFEPDSAPVSREEFFEVTGPVEIDIATGSGLVVVQLGDEPGVHVQVRPTAGGDNPWVQGINSLMQWFQNGVGQGGGEDLPRQAVEQSRIELTSHRVVVHAPRHLLKMVPLEVIVRAPGGSGVMVRSGAADVTLTGPAGRIEVQTGSGDVAVDRADGAAQVTTGSGALRLGPMLGGLRARSGSGEIEVSSLGGPSKLTTGSGDIWLGTVQSDVQARTGSGDLNVADAACGGVDLNTGSGEIRIGVRSGTVAQVDLSSGSGQAHSELNLNDRPPSDGPKVRVRGRTGSGNAVVTSAIG